MTGFGNRSFEFIGVPNTIYSLISEKSHKVSPIPLLIHLSCKLYRVNRWLDQVVNRWLD